MELGQAAEPGALSTSETWPEQLVAFTGKAVAWLTVLMVLLTFAVVVLRYGFNLGWIGMQESVTYLHATVFMLASAWTLQADEHVRVDIFYRNATPRRKAWVDILGTLFLLIPFCVFMLVTSWNYVALAWGNLEGSREAGGLPFVYLLKTLIILMPALLLVQSGNGLVRNSRILLARSA